MPTIDQLSPATSAADTDEFPVSQAGVTRSVTRAQVLNGLQPAITLNSGSLLGRISTGIGAPEVIAVGSNLLLSSGTLSASAVPFVIGSLPAGNVPASGDLLSMSQSGTNVAVTYGQLLSGISGAANIDVSQALVTPTGAAAGETLASLAANMLPLAGGTLTGVLALAAAPASAAQAANKAYVDQQVSTALQLAGGSMTGRLTLAAPPQQPLDSATKGYADAIAAGSLPLGGGSLSGALLLNAAPSIGLQAATKNYADLKLSRSGDTLSGILALAADPVSPSQAATKNYVDTQLGAALSLAGGTMLGGLVLASDPTANAQAATKQYVDQHVLRAGDTLTGALILGGDPVVNSQASTKHYVDSQFAGAVSLAGSSMSGALLLASDPAVALQASTKQYVDLHVVRAGDTLTGALYLASNPTSPLQAATKQYVDGQLSTAITAAGATFTGPVTLASDPTLQLQAATKEYADTKVLRAGDTLTGTLTLAANPVAPLQAATKGYVDTQVLGSLPLSGGSLTGSLSLAADPVSTAQAATKHYVDSQVATAVPVAGGSLTGFLSLSANPTATAHAANKQYVDGRVATALPLTGGSLSGTLTLSAAPTLPLQAATKAYVDANPNSEAVINVALPPYGAKLNGVTDDTAAFAAAYQAAPAGSVIYVPNGKTVLQQPGNWGIALTKRVKWIVDGTTLADGTPLASAVPTGGAPAELVLPGFVGGNTPTGLSSSQGSSSTSDFTVNQSSYIVNHNGGTNGSVVTNVRNDTIIYNSPGNYVWGGLDRLIWTGVQTPTASTPAQHVSRYVQTVRQAAATNSSGAYLPQPQLWAACLEYRDTTGLPSSATGASLTIEMDWMGNGLDDANCRTIQSLVIGQNNTSGAAVEVSTIIGVYLNAGSSGSAKTVFAIGVPFSNAVLDASFATSISNAPVIKLAAGQTIAFEATNSNTLCYNSKTGLLTWNQGTFSYPVGKGITVGWQNVVGSSITLPHWISGNIIFLNGTSAYTVTLPAASTVAAGTGFTFSVIASGPVSIVPNGADGIDCGPVVLQVNDRYHIVSDGVSCWREVFRTNAVSPHFVGTPVLPSYTVANLPAGGVTGAMAFASNGRKPAEAAGAGSGVTVFYDGLKWVSSCSGSAVAA
jgi:LysM repeat protein